jgi:hypothetical protein
MVRNGRRGAWHIVALGTIMTACGATDAEGLQAPGPTRYDCREILAQIQPPTGGDPSGEWEYMGACSQRLMARLATACEASEGTYWSTPVEGGLIFGPDIFDRQSYAQRGTFEVRLAESCVSKLGGACSAQSLFELDGTCDVSGGQCQCTLKADPLGLQWRTSEFSVEGSVISVTNTTGSLEASYDFTVDGDQLVHETSREFVPQDWYLLARRRPL